MLFFRNVIVQSITSNAKLPRGVLLASAIRRPARQAQSSIIFLCKNACAGTGQYFHAKFDDSMAATIGFAGCQPKVAGLPFQKKLATPFQVASQKIARPLFPASACGATCRAQFARRTLKTLSAQRVECNSFIAVHRSCTFVCFSCWGAVAKLQGCWFQNSGLGATS